MKIKYVIAAISVYESVMYNMVKVKFIIRKMIVTEHTPHDFHGEWQYTMVSVEEARQSFGVRPISPRRIANP